MKRRDFLKKLSSNRRQHLGFPAIIKSSVFAAETTPNSKINIGQIGFGRIARGHDLVETIKHDICRIVAVADVDSRRALDGKKWIEDYYTQKNRQIRLCGCQGLCRL